MLEMLEYLGEVKLKSIKVILEKLPQITDEDFEFPEELPDDGEVFLKKVFDTALEPLGIFINAGVRLSVYEDVVNLIVNINDNPEEYAHLPSELRGENDPDLLWSALALFTGESWMNYVDDMSSDLCFLNYLITQTMDVKDDNEREIYKPYDILLKYKQVLHQSLIYTDVVESYIQFDENESGENILTQYHSQQEFTPQTLALAIVTVSIITKGPLSLMVNSVSLTERIVESIDCDVITLINNVTGVVNQVLAIKENYHEQA